MVTGKSGSGITHITGENYVIQDRSFSLSRNTGHAMVKKNFAIRSPAVLTQSLSDAVQNWRFGPIIRNGKTSTFGFAKKEVCYANL
jgi:hypothetical protein